MNIPAGSIHIHPHRQRQEFDPIALADFAAEIEKDSLFHPILVRASRGGECDKPFVLVAGERRLRAIKNYIWGLGKTFRHGGVEFEEGMLPCVDLGSIGELEAEVAEYEENARRLNLTWQEQCAADAKLASLRQRLANAKLGPTPTLDSVAKEARGETGPGVVEAVRQELIVSHHLDDPDVAKAPSLKEAYKVVRKKDEARRTAALASSVGKTFSAGMHRLYHSDTLTWLALCQDFLYDVILTDPPYGMEAQDFGDAGGRLSRQTHEYDDTYETWVHLLSQCSKEWWRVAKPEAHLYVCCDFDRFHELKAMLQEVGWWVHRTPILNLKPDGNRVPWPEHGPQRKWEMVLYAVKGKKRTRKIAPDIIETRGDENLNHGAQKPVALFRDLLSRSILPGDRVLDNFCGTGPIFEAAHQLQCIADGVEGDAAIYGVALERLQRLKEGK